MDIKIGVTQIARELEIETELTSEQIIEKIQESRNSGNPLVIDGSNGRRLVVPVEEIGYIDMGAQNQRPVGFGV